MRSVFWEPQETAGLGPDGEYARCLDSKAKGLGREGVPPKEGRTEQREAPVKRQYLVTDRGRRGPSQGAAEMMKNLDRFEST